MEMGKIPDENLDSNHKHDKSMTADEVDTFVLMMEERIDAGGAKRVTRGPYTALTYQVSNTSLSCSSLILEASTPNLATA